MTKCKRCDRATELFVCKACVSELRDRLRALPWWLDRLTETAVGQARLSPSGRGGRRRVLHGDDTLVSHVEPFPRDKDSAPTERDRQERYQAALWHALALGRANGHASDELDRIGNALSTTIRDMCETRGLQVPEFRTQPNPAPANDPEPTRAYVPDATTAALPDACARCYVALPTSATGALCDDCDGAPELRALEPSAENLRATYTGKRGEDTLPVTTLARMAKWLYRHAGDVALQENAAEICDEIERVFRSATRVVNRPPEPTTIGPCVTDPAPDEVLKARAERGDTDTVCGYALTVRPPNIDVECPQCGLVYVAAEVLEYNLAGLEDRNVTVRELVDVVLPRLNEHVPRRTLERWIQNGQVSVRGYDVHGHQMVRIGDVRQVRAQRPRHAKRA
ncbi:hypothetical protein [Mycobacteroides abscessus]|uniref:hypothetical protein n=1 Tax=Mycobacteroides abscessus TaxID=36809 RepID=UPI00092C4B24|nr:hypothetical protein [Mycobacteroides abscessus]SHY43817.1 bacteriophage protein [Mycobacteroides abscessus subsp. abscessus]